MIKDNSATLSCKSDLSQTANRGLGLEGFRWEPTIVGTGILEYSLGEEGIVLCLEEPSIESREAERRAVVF